MFRLEIISHNSVTTLYKITNEDSTVEQQIDNSQIITEKHIAARINKFAAANMLGCVHPFDLVSRNTRPCRLISKN